MNIKQTNINDTHQDNEPLFIHVATKVNEVTLFPPQVARQCLRTHHLPPPAPRDLQQALMAAVTSW